ncbi:hypothetical protein [Methylovirgula sp. HY1]|uniref:hypothetical protein n=1 Tax=Methylovirgula sp. HY1 TaxID=2822761 RepID=UPI001C5A92DB|nr:hypothetical protein [Methylovirgula sp. HY1]QXX74628.1 hypothetical protein MHY1_01443 [Methylovirgula sp. HY1]
MPAPIDHNTLHRTAKYFMDSGKAPTAGAAMDLLRGFAVNVEIDAEAAASHLGQIALLSFVNLARRTFLGGVEVVGQLDVPTIGLLMPGMTLDAAVRALGGSVADAPGMRRPTIVIGGGAAPGAPAWRLHWKGWSGGVLPASWTGHVPDAAAMPLTPMLAAAVAVSEAFSYFAGDHTMVGRRAAGLSLWDLSGDWLMVGTDPALALLPSRLWLLGLGNLGQAYAWALACLPYPALAGAELLLQDFDIVGVSNDSTSMLSSLDLVGRKKTRAVAVWLEARGFTTIIEERRFNQATRWSPDDPGAVLCGVDSGTVRSGLDDAGFPLIVEAGLGAGPNSFRSIAIHTLPASRPSSQIWRSADGGGFDPSNMPAYDALKSEGMDDCGLAQLASRTVGVPFVGAIAATLVVAELLRRLHGGPGSEVASLSTLSLEEIEQVAMETPIYSHGHLEAGDTTLKSEDAKAASATRADK